MQSVRLLAEVAPDRSHGRTDLLDRGEQLFVGNMKAIGPVVGLRCVSRIDNGRWRDTRLRGHHGSHCRKADHHIRITPLTRAADAWNAPALMEYEKTSLRCGRDDD